MKIGLFLAEIWPKMLKNLFHLGVKRGVDPYKVVAPLQLIGEFTVILHNNNEYKMITLYT